MPSSGDQRQRDGMCDICDVALVATRFEPWLGASEGLGVSDCNSARLRRLKKTYSKQMSTKAVAAMTA
jgi:hypothetical protein